MGKYQHDAAMAVRMPRDLKESFNHYAAQDDRSASLILRGLIRQFVAQRMEHERETGQWLIQL